VDTGSTRAWIPKKIADELGIQPVGNVSLELAEGSVKELPMVSACSTLEEKRSLEMLSLDSQNVSQLSGHMSFKIFALS